MTPATPADDLVGAPPGRVRRGPAVYAGLATLVAALVLAVVPRMVAPPVRTAAADTPVPAARGTAAGHGTAERAARVPDPASRGSRRIAPATAPVGGSAPAAARRYDGRLPTRTRQLLVVSAASTRTTYGTVRRYVRTGAGWVLRDRWRARLGANGMVRAARRVQGSNTTPTGRFAITEAFGRRADPGTALPYRHLTDADWWVQDRRSPYYNQRRLAGQGGFRVTTAGRNGSEHLRAMGPQYDFVAVIDFNRPDPVVGRGSGIFLHVTNGRATAGCVSIPRHAMRKVLRWLDPAKVPVVVIGQRDDLRRPA